MFQTLNEIEGVSEEQLDRLAALGMISVHDIEEVGAEVIVGELEIEQAVAEAMVAAASARVKVLEEEQAREKEEAERQAAMGLDDLLGGGAVAAEAAEGASADTPAPEGDNAEAEPTEPEATEEPSAPEATPEPDASESDEQEVPAGAGEDSTDERSA
jgi:N utilization substance protein A